jgi:hypothetical protein
LWPTWEIINHISLAFFHLNRGWRKKRWKRDLDQTIGR